jgi:ABC-type amino acid transport system permease subunit
VIVGALLLYLYEVLVGGRGLDGGYILDRSDLFLNAALLNLYVTSVAFVIGMAIGFFLGWLRTARAVPLKKILADFQILSDADSRSRIVTSFFLALTVSWFSLKYVARRLGDGYVEIVRGTPLFVQILFVWSMLVVNFPGFFTTPAAVALNAGLIALTLNTGGYQSEIFRGGLQTVHSGQVEGARALGLSRAGTLRYIVLPQTLRLIIPPLTNEWIGLFKASTLLFVLGVRGEITFVANSEAFRGNAFEVFAVVTGIFLLITVSLAKVVQFLEKRFRIPGLGIQPVAAERASLFGRATAAPRLP